MKKISTLLLTISMATSLAYPINDEGEQKEHLLFTIKNTTDEHEFIREIHELKNDTIVQLNQAKDDCIVQLNVSKDELLKQISVLFDEKIDKVETKVETIAKNSRQDVVVTIASGTLCASGIVLAGTGTYRACNAQDMQSASRAGATIVSGVIFTALGLAGTTLYDKITKK